MTTLLSISDPLIEKTFLGCCLAAENLNASFQNIDPTIFDSRKHRLIFEAMKALQAADKLINILTVCDYLRDKGLLEDASGASYISELLHTNSIPGEGKYYLNILCKYQSKRKLHEICQALLDSIQKGTDIEVLLGKAKSQILDLDSMQKQTASDVRPRPVYIALRELVDLFKKYISLQRESLATLAAFWILGTYCYEVFIYYGYLALRSATPRCGKSRMLKLISLFSKGNPPITTIPTAATLFRSNRDVLILDEVDRLRNQDKEAFGEVLAVLNFGFEKGGIVERTEKGKDGWVVKPYSVYGPKALAGIEGLADTLADRSFQIEMIRTNKRMPRLNVRKMAETANQIRRDFEGFMDAHEPEIDEIYLKLPDELAALSTFDDRLQDVSEPILVLASCVDAALPDGQKSFLPEILDSLNHVAGRREVSTREKQLLGFIEIVEPKLNGCGEVFIATSVLINAFSEREDLSWLETGRAISGFLKRFDLFPGFDSAKTHRGYRISEEWVAHWKGRYK